MIGLLGVKKGMTQIFSEDGEVIPVTVLHVDNHTVISRKTKEEDGYNAVLLGSGSIKSKHVSKPYEGQFSKDIKPQRHLFELKDFGDDISIGDVVGVDIFSKVPFVDVTGTSK
ncbi:MAG: 50S ribosomal protein L3, partial [Salinispira sp.]